jgi:hypothetical protein
MRRFNPLEELTFAPVPLAVLASALTLGAKLTYGLLSRYAGTDGSCYPSVKRLATDLKMSERQVKNYTAELVKEGYIERSRKNRNASNHYSFLRRPEFENYRRERKNSSSPEGKNVSPKESTSRDHLSGGEDYDSLPPIRRNRESRSALEVAVTRQIGREPSKSQLGKIISATPSESEAEALQAIRQAELRGYGPDTPKGGRSAQWFVSVVRNYWGERDHYALPPSAPLEFTGVGQVPFESLDDAA